MLLVGIVGAAVFFIVSAKSGLQIVSVDFSSTQDNACWAHGGGYAVLAGEVVKTGGDQCQTIVDHDFWDSFERQGNPETTGPVFHELDSTFDTWHVLARGTYFNVHRDFVLQFTELIISVDDVDLETAVLKNGDDLFDTIDDVLGSLLVRCTECFLVAFAGSVERLGGMELDFG